VVVAISDRGTCARGRALPDLGGLGGTFWATLFGAVVGGVITFLIQINGVRIARKERLDAKRQEDLQTARLAMVKVIRMLSNMRHIRSAILAAKETPATQEGAESGRICRPLGRCRRQWNLLRVRAPSSSPPAIATLCSRR
jgi:hypothetical protein